MQAIAVEILGPDAAFKTYELLLLQTGLANALASVGPGGLERITPWIWPAALLFGSLLYGARLARIAVQRMAEQDEEQPVAKPQPAAPPTNGNNPQPQPAAKEDKTLWNQRQRLQSRPLNLGSVL